MIILSVAMPVPLRRSFDYQLPANCDQPLLPGMRVLAPFGNRKLVGVLLEVKTQSELEPQQLKPIIELLDATPVLTPQLMALCHWAANYYQHPLGDVMHNALPALLRKGQDTLRQQCWRLSHLGQGLGPGALKKAPKQAQLLALLQRQPSVNADTLKREGIARPVLKALLDRDLVESFETAAAPSRPLRDTEAALTLNAEQQLAYDSISLTEGYNCYLLEGVTGSGKTEVYLQLIQQCLDRGQQVLVLIPEIGLTPQTLGRFQRRFNCTIAVMHSALTDRERLLAWQWAGSGEAGIVIGTRSAIFTPLDNPGLLVIDEEHDSSFKQQDGFRYSARDIAITRAHREGFPVVLGSATPGLETLHNALQGRYHHLQLTQRAGNALPPSYHLLDIRNSPMEDGFSPPLLHAIGAEIKKGNQVLVFINRRGFSPALMCFDCGFVAQCQHCDARMTVHFGQRLLRCHHCEAQQPLHRQCPDCNSSQLDFRGSGTERSEQALKRMFPTTQVIRIDRDTTSRKNAMSELIEEVYTGEPCILVGTQMLAKGHHFPDVTLVAIIDADGGLFSTDFRGPEKMGQLLVQVAGRAGRAAKPGRVLIQTLQPEHPLINALVDNHYHHYARTLLAERERSGLPPFGHLALVRAEAQQPEQAEDFLLALRQATENTVQASHPSTATGDEPAATRFFGPLPAPMARRAGFFRGQLLLAAAQRKQLHHSIALLCHYGDQHPLARKLRWSVDVDPIDMY
ncbi:MAG: primosomal protein N' (replication factor Y) [Paraglaciecola psychrophila]|jgi:primosomal protein N' (replication factor Y)